MTAPLKLPALTLIHPQHEAVVDALLAEGGCQLLYILPFLFDKKCISHDRHPTFLLPFYIRFYDDIGFHLSLSCPYFYSNSTAIFVREWVRVASRLPCLYFKLFLISPLRLSGAEGGSSIVVFPVPLFSAFRLFPTGAEGGSSSEEGSGSGSENELGSGSTEDEGASGSEEEDKEPQGGQGAPGEEDWRNHKVWLKKLFFLL